METVLICLLILYNVWLVSYILLGKQHKSTSQTEDKPQEKAPQKSDDIVGKSRFKMETKEPTTAIPTPQAATIEKGEEMPDIEVTFADTKEKTPPARLSDDKIDEAFDDIRITDVPVKYKNGDDEQRPVRRYATGASFEEIGQSVNVADNPNSTDKERKSAGQIFSEMEGDEIFDRIISSSLERAKRIMGLMDEHSNKSISGEGKEIGKVVQPHSIPEIPTDISGFNIRDFV